MVKTFIAILLFLTAATSFAQGPGRSMHEFSYDLYAGYMENVPDYSPGEYPHNIHGYDLGFTLNISPRWGVTVSGGQLLSTSNNVDQWQLTAGPKVYILTGRFRPYGIAQIGASNQDGDEVHPGIATSKATAVNALTFRLGGGADYQLTRRIYWRMGQWAAQPVPWGRHASSLFQNFSTGVGFQF